MCAYFVIISYGGKFIWSGLCFIIVIFLKHTLNVFQTRRNEISINPTTIWRKNYSQPDPQVSSIPVRQKLANLTQCWIVIRSMSGNSEIWLTAVLRENRKYLLWILKIHYTIFWNDNHSESILSSIISVSGPQIIKKKFS